MKFADVGDERAEALDDFAQGVPRRLEQPAQPVAVKVAAKITTVYTGMFKDRKGEYLSFALKGKAPGFVHLR